MQNSVIFDPLLPVLVLAILAVVSVVFILVGAWRGLSGWWLRAFAAALLLAAIANPSMQTEDRAPLSDVVLLVVDQTASDRLADRSVQVDQAIDQLQSRIGNREKTELKIVTVQDGEGNSGTRLMAGLADAMSQEPRSRIAGAFLLTDGQLHDVDLATNMPAPLHVLLTGQQNDWDRRLVIQNAPAFAILGEEITLELMIEDQGMVPANAGEFSELTISIDGNAPQVVSVPVGGIIELPMTLPHGGMNVVQFSVAEADGELTDRNNSAVVQINGVRDRLRVLLVSGEPHPGERTWRNLLKSDSSVDLVHFTILRPPEKQDGVPVSELSLIAFPTRELFIEKIDEFDLIIFDRYRRRGILPSIYLENVVDYVKNGGAVLFAAGPDFASADSLFRSPLGGIIPAEPTSIVVEQGYRPTISELGARHPVTAGLDAPFLDDGQLNWGRWFRLIEAVATSGTTVMTDEEERPLLVLDRVGDGRIALLATDHAWLWGRGYEGGGPQLELLRRLAHWMMKEPELEEESLSATAEGQTMTITRQTLLDGVPDLKVIGPDGQETAMAMTQIAPGKFQTETEGPEIGLYRLIDGEVEAVVALGPSAPKEFEETISTGAKLQDMVATTRGGILRLENGFPNIRVVQSGRVAAGRGWVGLTPRGAFKVNDVSVRPMFPAWVLLLIAAALTIVAWLREGANQPVASN